MAKKAKSEAPRRSMFQPGAGDHTDPFWWEQNTNEAEIAEWIAQVAPMLEARRKGTLETVMPLFSNWQRDFYTSIAKQFEINRRHGHTPLLTGKQLVVLYHMVKSIADDTAADLALNHGP